MIYNGEIGKFEGVRFIEQTNIPKGNYSSGAYQTSTNFILEYELAKWLRLQTNVYQSASTQQQLFQRMQGSGADLLFFFSY